MWFVCPVGTAFVEAGVVGAEHDDGDVGRPCAGVGPGIGEDVGCIGIDEQGSATDAKVPDFKG